MTKNIMRIKLKAYDHELIDKAAKDIVTLAQKSDALVRGPVPLPTKKQVVTILRAVHKYKDSREQFEQRIHKRLIDIVAPSKSVTDAFGKLNLPAGVSVEIKYL